MTCEGYPTPLALSLPSETSSKDTDDTGTEIRDPGTTTGHITTPCQGKSVLYIVIVNYLCWDFLYEITIHSSLLPGFSPLLDIKPVMLMLPQHSPRNSAVLTLHSSLRN